MNILITGITGRIGANLASVLVQKGHTVRGLVWPRDPRVEKLRSLDLDLQEGSLTRSEDVARAVEGSEAIYHLGAAFQGGGPFTEADYFEINIRGTFNVLEAARAQKDLQHLFFASSDAVYEKYVPGGLEAPIHEDRMPRQPRGWYSLSKSAGEELCTGYWRTYGLPVTIFRFCYVLGAGEVIDFPQFYLSRVAKRPELSSLWQGEERLVILRDEAGRAYKKHVADVRDIVGGCAAALGRSEVAGEAIQLAAPRAFTWDEAVPHLSDRLGVPFVEAEVAGVPTHYEFDLSKCRSLVGYEPAYDIIRMIDDALAYRRGEDIGVLPTD
ncbi:MAG: NAD(P)-dependent oxidoreductase [Candidatus Latescibacteria bacterium]|nr:NAD(P)-dependent oxidoreductase [Candidatus Latescibacterota bacterium]